jgi:hypothetical protein
MSSAYGSVGASRLIHHGVETVAPGSSVAASRSVLPRSDGPSSRNRGDGACRRSSQAAILGTIKRLDGDRRSGDAPPKLRCGGGPWGRGTGPGDHTRRRLQGITNARSVVVPLRHCSARLCPRCGKRCNRVPIGLSRTVTSFIDSRRPVGIERLTCERADHRGRRRRARGSRRSCWRYGSVRDDSSVIQAL